MNASFASKPFRPRLSRHSIPNRPSGRAIKPAQAKRSYNASLNLKNTGNKRRRSNDTLSNTRPTKRTKCIFKKTESLYKSKISNHSLNNAISRFIKDNPSLIYSNIEFLKHLRDNLNLPVNDKICTMLISNHSDNYDSANAIIQFMKRNNCSPNLYSYSSLIKYCSKSQVLDLLDTMFKEDIFASTFFYEKVLKSFTFSNSDLRFILKDMQSILDHQSKKSKDFKLTPALFCCLLEQFDNIRQVDDFFHDIIDNSRYPYVKNYLDKINTCHTLSDAIDTIKHNKTSQTSSSPQNRNYLSSESFLDKLRNFDTTQPSHIQSKLLITMIFKSNHTINFETFLTIFKQKNLPMPLTLVHKIIQKICFQIEDTHKLVELLLQKNALTNLNIFNTIVTKFNRLPHLKDTLRLMHKNKLEPSHKLIKLMFSKTHYQNHSDLSTFIKRLDFPNSTYFNDLLISTPSHSNNKFKQRAASPAPGLSTHILTKPSSQPSSTILAISVSQPVPIKAIHQNIDASYQALSYIKKHHCSISPQRVHQIFQTISNHKNPSFRLNQAIFFQQELTRLSVPIGPSIKSSILLVGSLNNSSHDQLRPFVLNHPHLVDQHIDLQDCSLGESLFFCSQLAQSSYNFPLTLRLPAYDEDMLTYSKQHLSQYLTQLGYLIDINQSTLTIKASNLA
ncbi:hypothetical protein DID75_04785 [Candidatus Marinamargulisbacteria bacterium SCGC AG-410-N11]|nr:hypothetical protein DID75_04785 [Candidatus Marinamargulisbacteria bacterium SCGC AG-410-N11]